MRTPPLVLTLLLLGAALPAGATVVVDLPREEMASRAELIVRARVGAKKSAWSEDGRRLLTRTELIVLEYTKGAGPERLTLSQQGGRVGDVVSAISGDARLEEGEEVVLLLRRAGGVVVLTALGLSAYHVERAPGGVPTVRRELGGLSFASLQGGSYKPSDPPAEPVETLEALLRSFGKGSR